LTIFTHILLKSSTSKTLISLVTSQITFCVVFCLKIVYKNNFAVFFVSIIGKIL